MEADPNETPPYLPATSPDWVKYYQRIKGTRRLGKGMHARIQAETKRRRRHANVMMLVSTVALVAVIAAFCALLGTSKTPEPEGSAATPRHHVS